MRLKTLLTMTLLVAGVAAFIWFFERDLPTSDEREQLANRLVAIEEDEVTQLTLEWEGGHVRLVRDPLRAETEVPFAADREWRLIEPMAARAERFAVDGLVTALATLEKKRTLDDGDPSLYSLEPARTTATLVAGDTSVAIEWGDEIPGTSDRMVRVAGQSRLYVVAGGVFDRVTKEPGEWRSKSLFAGQRAQVERIRLVGGEGDVLLARRGSDFWLEAPVVDAAHGPRVDSLLAAITTVKAESFVDDPAPDLSSLGLDPPTARIEVVLAGEDAPFVVELGADVASDPPAAEADDGQPADSPVERYARVGSQLVSTTLDVREALERTVDEWRSLRLAGLSGWEIDELVVRDGAGELVLTRDEAEWRRGEEEIDYTVANALVSGVADAEAVAVRPAAGESATAAVEMILRSANDERTIRFLDPGDGSTEARVSGRTVALELSVETWSSLLEKIAAVRAAEPIGDGSRIEGSEDDEE